MNIIYEMLFLATVTHQLHFTLKCLIIITINLEQLNLN